MQIVMPVLSPPRATYAYQPAEATYALTDVGGEWTVKRLSTRELVVTLRDEGDPQLKPYTHEVVFYFNADGHIDSATGYAPAKGRHRQSGSKAVKFPRKKAFDSYFANAAAMRARLLAEPVRDLPVLAEFTGETGLHRLVVLARDAEDDYEVINVNADLPTDCVAWHGPLLAEALESALPEAERDLLCAFIDFDERRVRLTAMLSSYTAAGVEPPPEALLETAHSLEARGWLTLQVSRDDHLYGATQASLTDNGYAVTAALARHEQARRQHDPFNIPCRQYNAATGLLTAEVRAIIFPPREPQPPVIQTRPMFGGPLEKYAAWLATLPADRREVAARYRAVVLSMVKAWPLPELSRSGKRDKLTQSFHAAQDKWNELRRGDTGRIQAGFYANELAHSRDADRYEHGQPVTGNALMGLEAEIPGDADPRAGLRAHLRLNDNRRRPAFGAPTRPTERQRSALDWPAQALESFPRWLAWLMQPPQSETLGTPAAITRASGQWAEWEGRNLALSATVDFLQAAGVQTPAGAPFDLRAWLTELGWQWTAPAIRDAVEAAGVLAAATRYALDERPPVLALSAGERQLYEAMAGQALGQALDLDSAAYWDKFQICPFDGADHFELAPPDAWELQTVKLPIAHYEGDDEAESKSEVAPSVAAPPPVTSDGPVIMRGDWKAIAAGKPHAVNPPTPTPTTDSMASPLTVPVLISVMSPPLPLKAAATSAPKKPAKPSKTPIAGPRQPCTLTCNGLGRLRLEYGKRAVSISWLGALTFVGDEATVAEVKRRFGQDLRKRRPGRRWAVIR